MQNKYACGDAPHVVIRVTRNGGDDPRGASIALSDVRNPHWTDVRPGDWQPLSQRAVMVYAWCSDVPGVAHSCSHGLTRRHSIGVIVDLDELDDEARAWIRDRADRCPSRPRHGVQAASTVPLAA